MSFEIVSAEIVENGGGETTDGRTYTEKWQVRFVGHYTPFALMAANMAADGDPPVPPRLSREHGEDDGSIVTSRAPSLDPSSPADGDDDQPGVAYLDIQYGPKPAGGGWQENPIGRWSVRGDGGERTIVLPYDREGTRFENSAHDLLTDIPEQWVPGNSYVLVYNHASNPDSIARAFSMSVNSTTWHGRDEKTVLLGKITWSKTIEDGTIFYPTEYPLTEARDGWRYKSIDNGFAPKNTAGDKLHKTDKAGTPVMVPVLLDGTGKECAEGLDPVYYPTDGYVMFDELDFTSLGLPDPSTF